MVLVRILHRTTFLVHRTTFHVHLTTFHVHRTTVLVHRATLLVLFLYNASVLKIKKMCGVLSDFLRQRYKFGVSHARINIAMPVWGVTWLLPSSLVVSYMFSLDPIGVSHNFFRFEKNHNSHTLRNL